MHYYNYPRTWVHKNNAVKNNKISKIKIKLIGK